MRTMHYSLSLQFQIARCCCDLKSLRLRFCDFGQRCAPAEWNLREIFRFSHHFWREILVKFCLAHPNPGKRTENFTKSSRQISRHLWQRKTEKIFTPALLQGSCSDFGHLSFWLIPSTVWSCKENRQLEPEGLEPGDAVEFEVIACVLQADLQARLHCIQVAPSCPLCRPPLFLSFSRHLFALFSRSKNALFCEARAP